MTSRSILILPEHRGVKAPLCIATQFSQSIMSKIPVHNLIAVSVPQLYKTHKKETKTIYISYENQQNSYKSTVNNQITHKIDAHLDTHHHLFSTMATKIINKVYSLNKSSTFKTNLTMYNTVNRHISLAYKQTGKIQNNNHGTASTMINKMTNISQNKYEITPLTSELNSRQEKENNFYFHKNNTFISEDNLVSKTVQNFIYKSENKIETRIQNIESTIETLQERTAQAVQKKSSPEVVQQTPQKSDLNLLSQKVYTLILKQFKQEQRRKGNLYA